jgi:hypothetical protein
MDNDGEYLEWSRFPKSYFKALDFTMGKDEYKFKSYSGSAVYVLGVIYLNIIILNLVIALVGDVYDSVMMVRNETELKLKASMLKELYNIKSTFLP